MSLADFIRCQRHPTYFVREFCQIRHPQRGAIPFALWPWQARLLQQMRRDHLLIILKARQLGVSELAAAYALWQARFTPGWLGLLVSRNQSDASDLLDRIGFMYDHLPTWLQAGSPYDGLTMRKHNTRILEFGHPTPHGYVTARIQSLPATKGTGRGKPASWVFLDEWAHQPWQEQIMAAIKPTLSTGGSLLGVSTANGVGNVFHQTWDGAQRQENGYASIFLPWSKHPEHDESWHATQAKSMEPWQLAQEHPATATEAFVQSGRPVFASSYLVAHEMRIRAAPPPLSSADGLTIWDDQVPQRGIIGADVAEGLADGDFDAAVLIDAATGKQLAALRGKWPPDIYALKLYQLGERYGFPLLAVERNNHGHAALLKLKDLGYPKLYHHEDALKADGHEEPRAGWVTNRATKPLIIDALAAGLREGAYQPMDQILIDEALVFSYLNDGKMGAPTSYHDDTVIAHAIAVHLANKPDAVLNTLQYFTDLANKKA